MVEAIEIQERTLEELGEKFAGLRIQRPRAEAAMEKSLSTYGQISPVVCARLATAGDDSRCELVDGFKRLRASRRLERPTLLARTLDLSVRASKAAMLSLNRATPSIDAFEEALVLHSLRSEDGLTQEEIGVLVGRHKSWVSRRLLLVEQLEEEVQQDLRLGLLSVVTAREVARLPRGNQEAAVAAIRKHRLSTREAAQLVSQLLSRPRREHEAILERPWEVVTVPAKLTGLVGGLVELERSCRRVREQVLRATAEELLRLAERIEAAIAAAEEVTYELKQTRSVTPGSPR